MHRFVRRYAVAMLGLFAAGWVGCARPAAREPVVETPAIESVAMSRGEDETAAMRLFGSSVERGEVIEGRAAANLEQHTFATDGADMDPDVDPEGKRIVFSSTRMSRHSHLYVKAIAGAAITQITDAESDDVQPDVSPDGRRIAFAGMRGGNWDIWLVDSDGRNVRQITNTPWPELAPSWSPDGRSLAYCRVNPNESRGELWIVEPDSPATRRMIGDGMFPAWSPKGDRIAYQRARERGSRWFSIWTVELVDGEPRYPTEIASSAEAALIAPAWSPDGEQLTFTAVQPGVGRRIGARDGVSGIGVVNVDGSDRRMLTDSRSAQYSPSWGVDGRIYFTVANDNTETIWSLRPLRSAPPQLPPVESGRPKTAEGEEPDAEGQSVVGAARRPGRP